MSDRYTAEVLISYEKTIANMTEFKKNLEAQKTHLEELQTLTKNSGIDALSKQLSKLKAELGPVIALHEAHNRVLTKAEKASESLNRQYVKNYAAIKKHTDGIETLKTMLDLGVISDKKFTASTRELDRQLAISNNTMTASEKTISSLRTKLVEGAGAVEIYKTKMMQLRTLTKAGAITDKERKATLKALKEEFGSATTKIGKMAEAEKKAAAAMKGASAANKELLGKYDQGTSAVKKRTKAIKELAALQKAGIITDQRAIELLRRFTLANSEATQAVKKLSMQMALWQKIVQVLHILWKGFFAVMAIQTLTRWTVGFAKVGENIELMGRKLEIFTKDAQSLEKVSEVALRVGVDFETLNKTMTRFAITTRGAFSTDAMLKWTEALVKAGRITGTTTQELKSGLLQLSQAMSAGRLMGDEYRSISENMPLLKQAIEDVFASMGRGSENLKTLSRNGEITADILVEAFGMLDNNLQKYGDTWDTIDASLERVVVQYQLFVAQLTQGNTYFKSAVQGFADFIGMVREGIFGKLTKEQEKAVSSGQKLVSTIANVSKSYDEAADKTSLLASNLSSMIDGIMGTANAFQATNIVVEENSEIFYKTTEEMKKAEEAIKLLVLQESYLVVQTITVGEKLAIATEKAKGLHGILTAISVASVGAVFATMAIHLLKLKVAMMGVAGATGLFSAALILLRSGFVTLQIKMLYFLDTLIAIKGAMIAAFSTNPFTAFLAVAATVTAAMVYYYTRVTAAEEAQKVYNQTLLESKDKMDAYRESIKDTADALMIFSSSQLDQNIAANQGSIDQLKQPLIEYAAELDILDEKIKNSEYGWTGMSNDVARAEELRHKISQLTSAMIVYTNNIQNAEGAKDKLAAKADELAAAFKEMGLDEKSKAFQTYSEGLTKNAKDFGVALEAAKKANWSQLELDKLSAQYLGNSVRLTKQYTDAISKKNKTLSYTEKLQKRINDEFKDGADKEAKMLKYAKKLLDEKKISQEAYNKFYDEHNKLTKKYIANQKAIEAAKKAILKSSKLEEDSLKFSLRHLKETNPLLEAYVLKQARLYNLEKERPEILKQIRIEQERTKQTFIELSAKEEKDALLALREEYSSVFSAQQDFNVAQASVNKLLAKGKISAGEATSVMRGYARSLLEAQAAAGDLGAAIKLMWEEFKDGVDENVKGLFSDVLKGEADAWDNFTDRLFDSFADMLADMAYELLKSVVWDFINGNISSSGFTGLLGGLVAGVASLFGGGSSSSSSNSLVSSAQNISSLVSAGGAATTGYSVYQSFQNTGLSVKAFGEATHQLMKAGAGLEQSAQLLEQFGTDFLGTDAMALTIEGLESVDTGFIAQLQGAWDNITNLEMPSLNYISGSEGLTDGIMEIGGEIIDAGTALIGDFATFVGDTVSTAISTISTMYSAITATLTNMAVSGAYMVGYVAGYAVGGTVTANLAAEAAAYYAEMAIPYIGIFIAAAKLIHMFTSGKKDPPEIGLWSSPAGQGDYSSFGDKDAYGNVDSLYGGVYFSSKHDMFQDRSEQVEQYMEYLSTRLNTLDDAISMFLDSPLMDAKIIEGMKNANLYLDDYRDLETSLDTFLLGRYAKIVEIVGGAFEEGFNIGLELIKGTDARQTSGEGFDFISKTPKGSAEAAILSGILFSEASDGLRESFKTLASGITKTTENILTMSEAAVLTNQNKLDAEALQRENERNTGPDEPYIGRDESLYYDRSSEGDTLVKTFADAIPKIKDFNTIMEYFVYGTEEAAAGLDELINASQDWINELYEVDSKKQVLNPNYSPSKMGEDDELIEAIGDKYTTITGQVAKSTTDIILDFIELDNTLTLLGIQTHEFGLVGIEVYKNFMDWAGTIDMAIEKIGQLYSVNTLLDSVSVGLFDMSVAGVEAADALVYVYEGFEEGKTAFESFGGAMTNFLDKFGTEDQKLKFLTDSYTVSIHNLNKEFGTTLGTNANHFADWIFAQTGNIEVDPKLKQGMISLTNLADSIVNFGSESSEADTELDKLNESMMDFKKNISDLQFSLNDTDETGKVAATRDLQFALDAFQIKADASTYSIENLNGWLDDLSNTTLASSEEYDLASSKATALVNAYQKLNDINVNTIKNTEKLTNSLNELGMTDEEIETKHIKEYFDEVNSFGLSLGTNGEDFGLKGFNAALFDSNTLMFGLESSVRSWGVSMKDVMFTSDMTVDEIIAFTQSLIDSGINIDAAIPFIYDWANGIKDSTEEIEDNADAIEAFALNMKELYYSLKGETEVENSIRQIREVFDEFGYIGSHASITSSQLADFIIKLDATDDATLDAEESITKLANAMINLDQIILDATANIESILADQKMTALDEQIAAEEELLRLAEDNNEIQTLTQKEAIAANEKILGLLDELKISDLNNQSPLEQLNASATLFKDAVSSGNTDDATKYAKDYLKFAQEYYASTSAYSDIFDTVTGSLEGMVKTKSEIAELPKDNELTSDWLEELKEQKEILQEQLDNKTFIAQNKELISSVNALALAEDESLFNVIYDKGIDLGSLGPELIGTLGTFNGKTIDDIAKVLQNENTNLESVSNFLGIDFNRLIVLLTEQGYLLKDVVGWDISSLIPDKSLLTPERIIKIAVEQGWSTQVLADQFEVSQQVVKDYIVRELKIPLDSINAWDAQIASDTKTTASAIKAIGDEAIMSSRSKEESDFAKDYGGVFTDNESLHFIGEQNTHGGKGTAEWLALIAANTYTTGLNGIYLNSKIGAKNSYVEGVGYKQGTNYVPEDQYAFLHKGEAVIPESYNMSNYGVPNKAVQTNEEIVSELRELKEELKQIKTVNAYGFKENIKYSKKASDIAQEDSERKRV